MLNEIQGIQFFNEDNIYIIDVKYLSEQLKKLIIEEIQVICYGENTNFQLKTFSLNSTINEFIKRYSEQDDKNKNNKQKDDEKKYNKQKGYIAELLVNIVVRHYTNFRVISPFFNLEDRGPKKGFDIITIDDHRQLWFLESKSGEMQGEDLTTNITNKINEAKNDLKKRLNENDNRIWINALNSVKYAIKSDTLKNQVEAILDECNTGISNDKKVILSGTIFSIQDNEIERTKIKKKYKSIVDEEIFDEITIIGIHKKTYEKIFQFLKEYVENNE